MLKEVTNYLATATLVSCTEVLTVCKGAGMDLGTAYEAIRISSGTSFVHETESQVILNGSRDILFVMNLVAKDIGLFQDVADRAQVPPELNPRCSGCSRTPSTARARANFLPISSGGWKTPQGRISVRPESRMK